MSTRLRRAASDAESASASSSRPIKSITHSHMPSDSEYEPGTPDSDDSQPSRVTRSRSRSQRPSASSSSNRLSSLDEQETSPIPAAAAFPTGLPPRTPTRSTRALSNKKSPRGGLAGRESASPSSTASPQKRGSIKKQLSSSRKGSDARREATAEEKRQEAARLEALYKEEIAKKEQAAAEARRAKTAAAKRTNFGLFVTLAVGLLALLGWGVNSYLDSLVNPTPSYRSQVLEAVRDLPILKAAGPSVQRQIESSLLAHVTAFEPQTGTRQDRVDHSAGEIDTNAASWIESEAGLLQPAKPLAMVLASDSRPGNSIRPGFAVEFVGELRSAFQSQPSGGKIIRFLDLAGACFRFCKKDVSDGSSIPWCPSLTGQQVRQVLAEYFKQTTEDDHPFEPLAAGIVLVRAAERMPRAAAEVFHRYVDDVQAPYPNALYVFEVHVPEDRPGDAANAADVLKSAWLLKNQQVDEVIDPLLSRVVRNVVDVRGK